MKFEEFLFTGGFHDNSSMDISSTSLRLQTFRLQTFPLLLYTRVQDSYTSNFCFSKSLFSSIPTSTYTMIPFINPTSTDTMIIQHIRWFNEKVSQTVYVILYVIPDWIILALSRYLDNSTKKNDPNIL